MSTLLQFKTPDGCIFFGNTMAEAQKHAASFNNRMPATVAEAARYLECIEAAGAESEAAAMRRNFFNQDSRSGISKPSPNPSSPGGVASINAHDLYARRRADVDRLRARADALPASQDAGAKNYIENPDSLFERRRQQCDAMRAGGVR